MEKSARYKILGIKRDPADSAGAAFSCGWNPLGRFSCFGPVFGAGGQGRRFEIRRSLPCLLMRVIEFSRENQAIIL
jgi:hypothetical protein